MVFADRSAAGHALAAALARHGRLRPGDEVVVLGVARGGVLVAAEVARVLGAALDVVAVRKLGVPYLPDLALGAIGEGGERVVNDSVLTSLGVGAITLAEVEEAERSRLGELEAALAGRPALPVDGRVVVVVDDGVATGASALAAVAVARARGAVRVLVAAPVVSARAMASLLAAADGVVAVETPRRMGAIAHSYMQFPDVDDATVLAALASVPAPLPARAPGSAGDADDGAGTTEATGPIDEAVEIDSAAAVLPGRLVAAGPVAALVVLGRGSWPGGDGPGVSLLLDALHAAGLATLDVDLTPSDDRTPARHVEVPLLAQRLLDVLAWAGRHDRLREARIGLLAVSTGAAAALWTAAEVPDVVVAVACRSGRVDLAEARLAGVRAPVLLVAGGDDPVVLDVNRRIVLRLPEPSRVVVVPGAGHLFGEPGTLAAAAAAVAAWFSTYLTG